MKIKKIINGITSYYYRFLLKRKGCILGNEARFCGRLSFYLDKEKNFSIGNGFVITGGRFINPLGARSIVAAGSVVTKCIPPDELWGGNPAIFIKKIEYS